MDGGNHSLSRSYEKNFVKQEAIGCSLNSLILPRNVSDTKNRLLLFENNSLLHTSGSTTDESAARSCVGIFSVNDPLLLDFNLSTELRRIKENKLSIIPPLLALPLPENVYKSEPHKFLHSILYKPLIMNSFNFTG